MLEESLLVSVCLLDGQVFEDPLRKNPREGSGGRIPGGSEGAFFRARLRFVMMARLVRMRLSSLQVMELKLIRGI